MSAIDNKESVAFFDKRQCFSVQDLLVTGTQHMNEAGWLGKSVGLQERNARRARQSHITTSASSS